MKITITTPGGTRIELEAAPGDPNTRDEMIAQAVNQYAAQLGPMAPFLLDGIAGQSARIWPHLTPEGRGFARAVLLTLAGGAESSRPSSRASEVPS